jgi:hypothetical protein
MRGLLAAGFYPDLSYLLYFAPYARRAKREVIFYISNFTNMHNSEISDWY